MKEENKKRSDKNKQRSTPINSGHTSSDTRSLEELLVYPIPWWKRLMDIVGASFTLLLLAPFFLLIAVIIKIKSPGPVFFKQERTGYMGKPFIILKFRTMHINAESKVHEENCRNSIQNDLQLKKVENDARIFPFGYFLRESCIDELPQLINVLKGEMSLVGPRPDLPYNINEMQRWHCARLNVPPGMTGLWQINGKNSTTFKQMIRYDLGYESRLSFKLELKILFLTIPAVMKQAWHHYRQKNSDHMHG